MKIVIDARTWGWTGIGRYARELVGNLQKLDKKNDYLILMQPQDMRSWQPKAKNFQAIEANYKPYSAGEQLGLARLLSSLKPDLVHFLYPSIPVLYRGPRTTTIHDLTLIDYKNIKGSPIGYELKHQIFKQVMRAAAKSDRVITPTEFVRQQIIRRYGRQPSEVIATSEAVDITSTKPSPGRLVEGDYLLYVGNYFPYKNISRLIEALPKIIAAHPHIKLVLTGKPDVFVEQLKRQVLEMGLEDSVIWTGFVSDEELNSLYAHAKLFVFPSLSEGFGLPALEAMAHGTPVATARATSLPEVCENAAAYFDPLDVDDIAGVINELLKSPKKLEALKKAGRERIKQFSWQRMAEQTLGIYNSVLKK